MAKVKSIFDYYGKTYNVYFITCLNYFPYGEHSFYIHESQRLQKLTIENGLGAVFEGSPTMVEYYNDPLAELSERILNPADWSIVNLVHVL